MLGCGGRPRLQPAVLDQPGRRQECSNRVFRGLPEQDQLATALGVEDFAPGRSGPGPPSGAQSAVETDTLPAESENISVEPSCGRHSVNWTGVKVDREPG